MKKLLLIGGVLVIGWLVMRSMQAPEPAPAPTASKPTPTPAEPASVAQKDATTGSSLNSAFPTASGGYKVVFTQEKDGFDQADLTKDGARLAALTVSDTAANAAARDKFKTSAKQIGGYPAAAVGSQGTAVLVGNRYQVQARSLSPSFGAAEREQWLSRFHFDRLDKLARR